MSIQITDVLSDAGQCPEQFAPSEVEQFDRDGYVIARSLVSDELRQQMLEATEDGLRRKTGPIEYEAEVHYPGSPPSLTADGGGTVRRLKQAHSRHFAFTNWIADPRLVARLQQLLGPDIVMPLVHHNCIMTKQPQFSSDTGWHRDIRYWSFQRPELVSVWLALGTERPDNGCLQLLPGTHREEFESTRLDEPQFLRPDVSENQELLQRRVFAELDPGDVLFFHCRTFHAATRNHGEQPKFSAVFTFRPADNPPVPASRSASLPELLVPRRPLASAEQ